MKQKIKKGTLAWINGVITGNCRYIALLTLLQCALGVTGVGYALFLRGIVESAVAGSASGVKQYAFLMVGLVVLQAALRTMFRLLDEYTKSTVENLLKSRLFSVLLHRDYGSVSGIHSGEWVNRLSSDSVVVADGAVQIIPGLTGMVVRISSALVALIVLEPGFGGIFVLAGLLLAVLTLFMRRKLKLLHSRVQEADGMLRVFLTERLGSLLTIRAFSKEDAMLRQGQTHMESHKAAKMRRNSFSNLCNTGLSTVMNGSYVIGAIFCGSQILSGAMTYGSFTAIMQLIAQAQAPITSISGFIPRYYAMQASAERLMEAERFPEESPHDAVPDINEFYRQDFQGLELRDVDFSYLRNDEGQQVLRHLNLKISKGDYVAFTGPSGCGKSTALKLLMCLYPVDSGERCILSRHGEKTLTAAWRGLYAYVPQGNQLMNGTIRDVVTFGERPDTHSDAEIYRALEIACAERFVRELKDGLDTMLGERGAGLSEGQMQRIAVARAIYSNRPVLLLDEATSALDEDTEKMLLKNLRSMTDRTVIIVTHRPAVLEVTDQEVKFDAQ